MSKKLEELFNLSEYSDDEDNTEPTPRHPLTEEELMNESTTILNALTNAEKIDFALSTVTSINEHDTEMEDIATRALNSYKDLCSLGLNVADLHAGKIFEVAAMMLKTAMDAKNSKVNRKLKTVELQLKKERLDLDKSIRSSTPDEEQDGKFDRNELMRMIAENAPKEVTVETVPSENEKAIPPQEVDSVEIPEEQESPVEIVNVDPTQNDNVEDDTPKEN